MILVKLRLFVIIANNLIMLIVRVVVLVIC